MNKLTLIVFGMLFFTHLAIADVCPDGTRVIGECILDVDGTFVGEGDSSYASSGGSYAPDSAYSGSTTVVQCPDGSYVVADSCTLIPEG